MPPAPSLQYVHRSADNLVATYANAVFIVITQKVTVEALDASYRANRAVANDYPHRVAALSMAHMGVSLPDGEVRKRAGEVIELVNDHCCCAAQVLGGEGFWASTMRSVVTAIEMIRPNNIPRKSFATQPEAIAWMAAHASVGDAWTAEVGVAARTVFDEATALSVGTADAELAGS